MSSGQLVGLGCLPQLPLEGLKRFLENWKLLNIINFDNGN